MQDPKKPLLCKARPTLFVALKVQPRNTNAGEHKTQLFRGHGLDLLHVALAHAGVLARGANRVLGHVFSQ